MKESPHKYGTTGQQAREDLAELGNRVIEDLQQGKLWRHIKRDLHDLYHFYLDEESRGRLQQMGRVKRAFAMTWWLLKALILKLSPVRRLLLLFSMWLIVMGDITFKYAAQDLDVTFAFSKFGYLVLLVVLMLELKDKLLARDELAVGRAVQLALMPCESPDVEGWDLWLSTRPANDVGGDLVDFVPMGPDAVALALGDVSGKGLGAALLMAKLQATFRAYIGEGGERGGLAGVGAKVNGLLCRDGLANRFATLLLMHVNKEDGSVRLLNAGHMPPLLLSGGEVNRLPPVAPLMGVLPSAAYVEQQMDLSEGDLLVAYSDGLTEAMNGKDEFFGEERLMQLMQTLSGLSARDAGRAILKAVDTFIGDERPSDDLSLVLLRRAPSPNIPAEDCAPAVS
jgi:phosphoserine phosphatase RsbU/P